MAPALCAGFGVPGWIISPGQGNAFSESDRTTLKQDLEENFMGAEAGGVAVSPTHGEIQQLQGPRQFIDLGAVRDHPEFRVCGQLEVPPIVAILAAGYRFSTAKRYDTRD